MTNDLSVSETLRKAIADSGLSLYRISGDTELHYAVVHRFANGGSCKAETIDVLAKYFGLSLQPSKPSRKKSAQSA